MSGKVTRGETLARVATRPIVDSTLIGKATVPAVNSRGRRRREAVDTARDREVLPVATDFPYKVFGKRKWQSAHGDRDDTLQHRQPLSETVHSTLSSQTPVTQGLWTGKTLPDSLSSPPYPRKDSNFEIVEADRKRLRRQVPMYHDYSWPCSRSAPFFPHDPQLQTLNLGVDHLAPWGVESIDIGQIGFSTVGERADWLVNDDAIHENETDHSLPELKWPFEKSLSGYLPLRSGSGDTKPKPTTTGSQGFPNLVTSGPEVLSSNNLFGYDREALMGGIFWA